MGDFLTIAFLLVFCLSIFLAGYRTGYKKGATMILRHWQAWIDEIEGE